FGVVTSGRPADLPGIERTVGLFIQTLPVRARWEAGDAFSRLLTDLKEQSLAQMQHGYLPLTAIGRDLFDHLLVFENYPYETTFDGGAVELARVDGFEQIPYPLGISVVQGNGLLFRFLYDPRRLDRGYVQGLGAKILALLEAVAAHSEVSCRDLESTLIGVAGGQSPALEPRSSDAERSGVISVLEMPVEAPATQAAAPRGIETALLGIYESVLGCPVPSVDADFFRLGGHSLLAMRVIAQVSKAFSVRLTIDDVMRHCSVRKLARFIESVTAPVERLAAGPAKEKFPLSSSQMRLWFLQRLHEDSRVHRIPFAARLSGSVNRDALQEALSLLERRHDALRLRVSATEPEQRLVPPGQLRLEYFDRPFSAEEMARAEMPFGFENPLVRVALFREPDGGFVLTFCAHHIVFDGWSAEIFVRELNQAYAAVLERRMPDWAPLDVGYAQYVEWAAKQGTPGLEAVREMLLPLP
ncbi:MAG TPA: condensation domain-containing protein, partial [Opitutaceae bacterium]|nr:condensation domain-containing protein [Opitutaceae bacterium]